MIADLFVVAMSPTGCVGTRKIHTGTFVEIRDQFFLTYFEVLPSAKENY
jgi:hypothetical protein